MNFLNHLRNVFAQNGYYTLSKPPTFMRIICKRKENRNIKPYTHSLYADMSLFHAKPSSSNILHHTHVIVRFFTIYMRRYKKLYTLSGWWLFAPRWDSFCARILPIGLHFFSCFSYIYLCKDADDDDDAAFFKALEKGARVQKCGNNLSDYLW